MGIWSLLGLSFKLSLVAIAVFLFWAYNQPSDWGQGGMMVMAPAVLLAAWAGVFIVSVLLWALLKLCRARY